MRPIRITGVVGTSPVIPLDTYNAAGQTQVTLTGAGVLQWTADDVFNASISPTWANTPAAVSGMYSLPPGVRGLRATGMAAPDVLSVSQQGAA